MTIDHHSPVTPSASDSEGVDQAQAQAAFETVQADMAHAGRALMTAEYWRGLILAGQAQAAGAPGKLPADLFPGVDPVVVQEVWDRAFAVGFQTAKLAARPYLRRDQLARIQGELAEAGYAAMAGSVGRALATAVYAHPADAESEGREHGDV